MHCQPAHHRKLPDWSRAWTRSRAWALALGLLLPVALPQSAWADGCYTCGGGSSDACKEYCRYSGSDTFQARKGCEAKGCRVTGTAACPPAGAKMCLAPSGRSRDSASSETIAWCASPSPRSAS